PEHRLDDPLAKVAFPSDQPQHASERAASLRTRVEFDEPMGADLVVRQAGDVGQFLLTVEALEWCRSGYGLAAVKPSERHVQEPVQTFPLHFHRGIGSGDHYQPARFERSPNFSKTSDRIEQVFDHIRQNRGIDRLVWKG